MRVEVRGLDYAYGRTKVLEDIDLTLDGPGLVCVIGPNGVGKSTLAKCILGLNRSSPGSVLIDGTDADVYGLKERAKVMGYVPVSSNETFSLPVIELVMMGRHPHQKMGNVTDTDRRIVRRSMNMMGIRDLALQSTSELSAGQSQKAAIAKGLAQTPRLLILDEPTSNLDVRHQMQVTQLLSELSHSTGMTVLMVSHDLNISAKYADEIVMMAPPGVIYRTGTPSDVLTEDNIRRVYGVDCRVIDDEGRPHVILKRALDAENDGWTSL